MKLRHLILASVAFLGLAACEKEPEGGKTPTTYDHPFTTISFTVGDETVEGVIGTDKTITAAFNNTEDFSSVKVVVALNPGFKITTPANLEAADLAEAPVLIFTDEKGAEIKYFITFTSNAFPLQDIKKVTISGLEAGEKLVLDNANKQVVIQFEIGSMVPENVVLSFAEGALLPGFSAQADLTYDFSEELVQPLVISNGEISKEYTVRFDASSTVIQNYQSLGFTEMTSTYVDPAAYPYIKVYKAESIVNVPVVNTMERGGWYSDNPDPWYSATGKTIDDDDYSTLGDYAAERRRWPMEHPIVVVTIDANAVTGKLTMDATNGVNLTEQTSLVSVTGTPLAMCNQLYENGAYLKNTERVSGNGLPFRAAIAFNENGKMEFGTLYSEAGAVKKMPLIKENEEGGELDSDTWQLANGKALIDAAVAEAADWDIVSAATNWHFGYRDGYALNKYDHMLNDGLQNTNLWPAGYVEFGRSCGYGWNGTYSARAVIGRTWDGKIGIAVCPSGHDGPRGNETVDNPFYGWDYIPHGYNIPQMAWIMRELGWRDVFSLGQKSSSYSGVDFEADIKINGQYVLGSTTVPQSAFCVSFDPKAAN